MHISMGHTLKSYNSKILFQVVQQQFTLSAVFMDFSHPFLRLWHEWELAWGKIWMWYLLIKWEVIITVSHALTGLASLELTQLLLLQVFTYISICQSCCITRSRYKARFHDVYSTVGFHIRTFLCVLREAFMEPVLFTLENCTLAKIRDMLI